MKFLKACGLVFLALLIATLLYAFLTPTLSSAEAEQLTEEYIQKMIESPETAYNETSEEFKTVTGLEDFKKFIEIADFDQIQNIEVIGTNIKKMAYDSETGGTANSTAITTTITYNDSSSINAIFTWVREDGEWKLHGVDSVEGSYKSGTETQIEEIPSTNG